MRLLEHVPDMGSRRKWHPRLESNQHRPFRRRLLSSLSYEDNSTEVFSWHPREESNLDLRFRRPTLFSLSYGDVAVVRGIEPRLLHRQCSVLPLDDTTLNLEPPPGVAPGSEVYKTTASLTMLQRLVAVDGFAPSPGPL